jgi:hypothetical protein
VLLTGNLRKSNRIVEGLVNSVFVVAVPKSKLDNACFYGVPFLATDEQMLAEAASKCNPSVVKPKFDTALQLGELLEGYRSLKRGLDTVQDIRRDIDRLNRWNSPDVRRLLGKRTFDQLSMKDWGKLAVSSHLGYTLAIRPLVGACKQLRSAFQNYWSTVQNYISSEEVFHGVSRRESTSFYSDYHPESPFCIGIKEVLQGSARHR